MELIVRLNELAGSHGVGRIDHVEDRLVGIKSRDLRVPGGDHLTKAHQSPEGMVLTRDVCLVRRR